jgi:hypothetical protein
LSIPKFLAVQFLKVVAMQKIKRFDDKKHLEALADRIDAVSGVSKDACGDYALTGAYGWIYHVGLPGAPLVFQIIVGTTSPLRWRKAKALLAFGRVTQDGDCEGSITFDGLPTAAQGEILRQVVGLRKRRTMSDDQRDALRRSVAKARTRKSALASKNFAAPVQLLKSGQITNLF